MSISIQTTNTYDVEMPEEAEDLLQRVIDQNLEMKERIEHLETKLKEVKSDRKAAKPIVERAADEIERLRAALDKAEHKTRAIILARDFARADARSKMRERDEARAKIKSIYDAFAAAQKPLDAEFVAAIFSDVEALYEP
jgi:chromosome segregation ATPase